MLTYAKITVCHTCIVLKSWLAPKRYEKCCSRILEHLSMQCIAYLLYHNQRYFLSIKETTYVTVTRAKDQLISIGNFAVFNSSKNELEIFNFYPSLLGQNFFVCFFGRIEKTKSLFEIN